MHFLCPQVHTFYEAVGYMIGAQTDQAVQEHLIENEVAVLRRVRHPSIIQLMEVDDTPTHLYLVMELVKVPSSIPPQPLSSSFPFSLHLSSSSSLLLSFLSYSLSSSSSSALYFSLFLLSSSSPPSLG
jgi:hypothetical protein